MANIPQAPPETDPRKVSSGTSYSANGVLETPEYLAEVGSSRLTVVRDPVPALANRKQELDTYKKMTRGDASVRASLRAGKASILGADFYTDAYSENEEDQIVDEFVNYNIFENGNIPWTKTLEGIVRFIENGFSCYETVWELGEWSPRKTSSGANRKNYTLLRKLAERPARTITEFTYDDNGGIVSVKQNAINARGDIKEVEIPINKLIIYTFEGDGNIEGESILRSAYRNWFYKDKLYTIDAIQKERHGIGVPDIEIQPGATPADLALAHELGANLRTNEKGYIVRTPALKIGFAEIQTQLVNALDSAVHHDNQIMKNILVQFINMGIEGGGGRSTGATAFDMFLKAMRYVANMICDYNNYFLIPKLVAYNFPTTKFPKMCVRNIGETKDSQMWSAAIRNLMQANGITPDMPTEQYLRQVMDMPLKTEERPPFADSGTSREQVLIQGNTADDDPGTNGTGNRKGDVRKPPARVGKKSTSDKSNNGGAGNVGVSPSKG